MDAEVARLRASFRSGKSLDLEWRKAQINGILRMVGRARRGGGRDDTLSHDLMCVGR